MQPIAKGKALAFLNPITRMESAPQTPEERRVIDREDLQFDLPI